MTEVVQESQEQFTYRINEIKRNIDRLYEEMYADEVIHNRIYETKRDQIRRLDSYYKEQIKMGVCFDKRGNQITSTHHVCRMIIDELDSRGFSGDTKREVYRTLGDSSKRAWRQPITSNGKVGNPTLELDGELQTFYEENMDYINELLNFDYFELPKPLQMSLAEHFYKAVKHHDKEWTKHGLQVVKHQADGYYVQDRFPDIIKIEETTPYEGELYDEMKAFDKDWREMMKKVKTQRPPTLTLEKEHQWAMGVRVWRAQFKPWGNFKWKKELFGWSKILLRKLMLQNKCAAAKSSRIPTDFNIKPDDIPDEVWANVSIKDFQEVFDEEMKPRGITREEIDKNHAKLIRYYQQFIRHAAGMIEFAQSFDGMTATFRARHSVRLHEKLSHNS